MTLASINTTLLAGLTTLLATEVGGSAGDTRVETAEYYYLDGLASTDPFILESIASEKNVRAELVEMSVDRIEKNILTNV